jgi:peroxiredoxin family protein
MNDIRYGMKRKSIKKRLKAKIDAWIKTITDIDLQTAIEKDVIVTGGSIASMLMGETVNDFDIYFRTKATTIKVARYYVEEFNKIKDIKVADGVEPCVPMVKEESIINCKGDYEDRVVIYIKSAGVAAIEQDVYTYFEGAPEAQQDEFVESLQTSTAQDGKYRPVFLSQNAITLSDSMQIVIRFFGEPDKIHSNYDFIHAMNYYDYSENYLHTTTEALESLMSRTLIYQGSLYPIASLFRLKKFINRGWRVSAGQMLKIGFQISELDLTDMATLREQLTGVDQAYMHQLLEALKEVDPELINAVYVSEIIDRIFGEN